MKVLLSFLAGAVALLGAALAQSEAVDADLDARTLEVAKQIRCVVCKNQSIAESDAGLAKDLRSLLRERIEAGDSNDEARDYLVSRYGEFVLLKPQFSWRNAGLWFGPALVAIAAIAGAFAFIRHRRTAPAAAPTLSTEERAELDRLLGEQS